MTGLRNGDGALLVELVCKFHFGVWGFQDSSHARGWPGVVWFKTRVFAVNLNGYLYKVEDLKVSIPWHMLHDLKSWWISPFLKDTWIFMYIHTYIYIHISTMHSICICNMSPHHLSTTISGWAFPIRLFEGGWGALMEGSSKRLPVWGPRHLSKGRGRNFPQNSLELTWVTWDVFFFFKGKIHPRNH